MFRYKLPIHTAAVSKKAPAFYIKCRLASKSEFERRDFQMRNPFDAHELLR